MESCPPSIASRAALAAHRAFGTRWPSGVALMLANLAPLYGVIALDWPVYPLILLFWIENVIIGLINVMRMLTANPASLLEWMTKLVMVPIFCVHYGIFTAGHGAFIHQIFGGGDPGPVLEIFTPGLWVARITELGLWIPAAVLAASHLFSFGWNYLHRGAFRTATLEKLMLQPYLRVVVLHIVVGIGSLAALQIGSPLWALLLIIAVKITLDLHAHLREHQERSNESTLEPPVPESRPIARYVHVPTKKKRRRR